MGENQHYHFSSKFSKGVSYRLENYYLFSLVFCRKDVRVQRVESFFDQEIKAGPG